MPSLVTGRPIDEEGLERGRIGLSEVKKLDLLLTLAGESGIAARLSIVLSESEGRGPFLNVGVTGVTGVVPGDVAAVEQVFSLKLRMDPRSSSCALALLLDVEACLCLASRFARDNGLVVGFLNAAS